MAAARRRRTPSPSFWGKVWRGLVAGLTSTDAVKAEKYLAVTVAVRILTSVGASAALVAVVAKLAG